MQVTPAAAQDTAKLFKAIYNRARLLSDPIYNMQMGAAELSNLLNGYNGSYLLTFAGYNAGRGRLRRSARPQGRPGRLGRTHSDRRDAQLRAADHGEPADLSRALRRRHQAADRGRHPARWDELVD